jgi:hypothetical protein
LVFDGFCSSSFAMKSEASSDLINGYGRLFCCRNLYRRNVTIRSSFMAMASSTVFSLDSSLIILSIFFSPSLRPAIRSVSNGLDETVSDGSHPSMTSLVSMIYSFRADIDCLVASGFSLLLSVREFVVLVLVRFCCSAFEGYFLSSFGLYGEVYSFLVS